MYFEVFSSQLLGQNLFLPSFIVKIGKKSSNKFIEKITSKTQIFFNFRFRKIQISQKVVKSGSI